MGQLMNVQRIYFRDAVKDMQGFTMGVTSHNAKPGDPSRQKGNINRNATQEQQKFYRTRGKQFNEVMRKLLGKDAERFETQTINNAPNVDATKTMKQLHGAGQNDPNFGPRGTIFVAKENLNSPNENAFPGTYAHELANTVDYRINGSERTYGSRSLRDHDTGAHVETIMFGDLQY